MTQSVWNFFRPFPLFQNVGQNAWVNVACNPFAASLGWRPFVPGFIAPIIKHKFVNLLLRGQDPTPHPPHHRHAPPHCQHPTLPPPPPHHPLNPPLLFLVDELLLLTNTGEKQVPIGILCPLVLSMWMCRCWFGLSGISLWSLRKEACSSMYWLAYLVETRLAICALWSMHSTH